MNTYLSHSLTAFITVMITVAILVMLNRTIAQDPLVYSVQPFLVDKEDYSTGDPMIIYSYRCNNEDTPLVVDTVERYFYNQNTGERFHVASSPGVIQVGCSWQEARVIDGFPPEMPTGNYVKRGVTKDVGRYRTVLVPWQTESFHYNHEER